MDMKLNFMHILADLGFDGVYPIYWIKESKACHSIYIEEICMHNTFKNQEEIQFGQNTKKAKCTHKKVWHQRIVQIISKNQINTKIDSKVQRVNKAKKPMSIKINKTHMLKSLSHYKKVKQITRNEITKSQREQGSNKQTKPSTLFMMAQSTEKKRVVFLHQTLDMVQGMLW